MNDFELTVPNLYSLCSQFLPVNPEGHSHRYWFPEDVQRPPFWQGRASQGFTWTPVKKRWRLTCSMNVKCFDECVVNRLNNIGCRGGRWVNYDPCSFIMGQIKDGCRKESFGFYVFWRLHQVTWSSIYLQYHIMTTEIFHLTSADFVHRRFPRIQRDNHSDTGFQKRCNVHHSDRAEHHRGSPGLLYT